MRKWWNRWLVKNGIIEPPPTPHKKITQCSMIGCEGPFL